MNDTTYILHFQIEESYFKSRDTKSALVCGNRLAITKQQLMYKGALERVGGKLKNEAEIQGRPIDRYKILVWTVKKVGFLCIYRDTFAISFCTKNTHVSGELI